jgi:hypothetical protein
MTVFGLLLFFYAPTLCGNVVFHYTTGVAVGICLSLVVLTYFLQKRVILKNNIFNFEKYKRPKAADC